MPASLVARDLTVSFGPDDRPRRACRSSPPPATASASSAPTAPARRRCCACSPACSSPTRGSVHGRAAVGHRRLPRPGARARRDRDRARLPRPAHRRHRRRRRARGRHRRPRRPAPPAPTTATRSPSTAGWRSAAPTSTPASARCGPSSASPTRLLDQPTASLSGGEAARAQLAAILLSRYDVLLLDEPTNDLDFAALDRLEALRRRPRRAAGRSSATTGPSSSARSPRVVELDERAARRHPLRGRLARLPRGAGRRPAATPRRPTRSSPTTRVGAAGPRPHAAAVGACRAWPRRRRTPKDNDKAQRDFLINRTEKQASKVRQSEKALARLDAVDKPWEPWELRLDDRRGAAQRRGRRPPRRRRGAAGRLHARPGRPRDRLGRAGRHPRARTARASRRCSRALLGRVAARRRDGATSGPASSSARSTRAAACSTPSARCSTPSSRRPAGTGRRRRHRGPHAAGQVRPRRRPRRSPGGRRCRRASAPGRRWRCSRPGASTASCSTSPPTTSTCPPSSSSSRPSRPSTAPCCSSPTTAGCSTRSPRPARSCSTPAVTEGRGCRRS